MKAVIDNDVLLKAACYRLLTELASIICSGNPTVGVLGSARFVVRKKIERLGLRQERGTTLRLLSQFLEKAVELEPLEEEQQLAADIELAAQEQGLFLDGGESLLCSILIRRTLPLLATGDKRAVTSLERLVVSDSRFQVLCGRVKCLEQLFVAGLGQYPCGMLRRAVCGEPSVDKSLTICFSCRAHHVDDSTILEGLQSYISDLRSRAFNILAA